MKTHLQRLVHLASNKILGGRVIEDVEKLDHASALAILAIHISLNVSPLFQLLTELVASHLHVCGFVSHDQMLVTISKFMNTLFGIDFVKFVMEQKKNSKKFHMMNMDCLVVIFSIKMILRAWLIPKFSSQAL